MAISHLLPFILMTAIVFPIGKVQYGIHTPEQTAINIHEIMFTAQMKLIDNSKEAEEDLLAAQSNYAHHFAQSIQDAAPDADERIQVGFSDAAKALAHGQSSAFAAARARIRTAIFSGSYAVVEKALKENDYFTAKSWLPVRLYRTTTRFSRPSTTATVALFDLEAGSLSASEALLAVQADLFDTYQAELTGVLYDLEEAHTLEYIIRSAELASLAEGFFILLSPAYSQQRGEIALQNALTTFHDLSMAALQGQDLAVALKRADEVLLQFRAAPLTSREQVRRAGQLLRYLDLIPVEYNRGVHGGQIIHEFEVQEAITFHTGAYAAFLDLENLLYDRDARITTQAKGLFVELGQHLDKTVKKGIVATTGSIEDRSAELIALIKPIMPADWIQNNNIGDFDVIAAMLDQMEAAVISKDYGAAESARLEAYAIMEVGPEAHLMAFAPQIKLQLEDLFWNGQPPYPGLAFLIKNKAPYSEVNTTRARLDETLDAAHTIVNAGTAPAAVAANAGMIMFREGLEAVIILASLMSSMKQPQELKYRKPMWLGTVLALAATILTWLLAHDVLQSLARFGEKLEAVVSLITIIILLVIMNWFFHKIYWTEWIARFHTRKRKIIRGEAGLWLGLVTLGFTSVYREGFETVLFLQALVLESGLLTVLIGVSIALTAVLLVGFTTFRLQVNLPYKKMLVFTGILIGAVLLQMIGTTVHILQVVGWLPIHVIDGISLPYWFGTWFGIYATWEGFCFQVLAALFVIGSYYLAERMTHIRRITKKRAGAY